MVGKEPTHRAPEEQFDLSLGRSLTPWATSCEVQDPLVQEWRPNLKSGLERE